MGACASIQYSRNKPTLLITNNQSSSTTIKVINSINGKLQEYRQPIKASHVISDTNPGNNIFLCSSESMFVNYHVPHVPPEEELQLDHIYFIMPLSKSFKPLTLQDLCLLAIKASLAIQKCEDMKMKLKKGDGGRTSFKGRRQDNGGARQVDFQLALKQLG